MDPSSYRLRSRSVPPNPLDHGQVVHTQIEGTPQTEAGERSSGRASPGLMLPGISSSVAGPEAGSASSGEKTLRSVTRDSARSDISETPPMPVLSPAEEPRVPPIRIGRRPMSSIGVDIDDTIPSDTLAVLGVVEKPENQSKYPDTEAVSEIQLFASSDIENPETKTTKHGSHAGSRTGATADAFSIPSLVPNQMSSFEVQPTTSGISGAQPESALINMGRAAPSRNVRESPPIHDTGSYGSSSS